MSEHVVYANDRNGRVREIERTGDFDSAFSRVQEHNQEEMDEWVETGHAGETWGAIAALHWEDFKAICDREAI